MGDVTDAVAVDSVVFNGTAVGMEDAVGRDAVVVTVETAVVC